MIIKSRALNSYMDLADELRDVISIEKVEYHKQLNNINEKQYNILSTVATLQLLYDKLDSILYGYEKLQKEIQTNKEISDELKHHETASYYIATNEIEEITEILKSTTSYLIGLDDGLNEDLGFIFEEIEE